MNYIDKLNSALTDQPELYEWLTVSHIHNSNDYTEHNINFVNNLLTKLEIKHITITTVENPSSTLDQNHLMWFGVTNSLDKIKSVSDLLIHNKDDGIEWKSYSVKIEIPQPEIDFDPESPRIPDEGDTWGHSGGPTFEMSIVNRRFKGFISWYLNDEETAYIQKYVQPDYVDNRGK